MKKVKYFTQLRSVTYTQPHLRSRTHALMHDARMHARHIQNAPTHPPTHTHTHTHAQARVHTHALAQADRQTHTTQSTWGRTVSLERKSRNSSDAVSSPSMVIVPEAGSNNRKRAKVKDDLPAPVLPTMPT